MKVPFVFGKLAVENNFTNRDKEIERLTGNFLMLVNTILISPRRWGKSSLVEKASGEARKSDKNLRFCFIDAFNVQNEEQFYRLLATEILKISASKLETLLENAKIFMGKFLPKLTFGTDNQNELTLTLDWKEVQKQPDDILNMAEKIAAAKGWKIIVCIDEFQNISTFDNPLAFQKKLRANWQKHQHTAYCLYGSKRHMLMDVFTDTSMPFYKFGDLMFLEKIQKEDWVKFITKQFRETKKSISKEHAALIADLAENHPYYVQQLAQQCWLRTIDKCSEKIITDAHDGIVDQLSLLFQTKTEEITNFQINFLHAVLSDVSQFSARETLEKFNIGSSANIARIKKSLENKEIIDIRGNDISILDPMYKSWLKTRYFKMK